MKNLLYLFASIVTLVSCESTTYVEYVIENSATDSIHVTGNDIIHNVIIDSEIAPDEFVFMTSWSKDGISDELFEPTSMFGDDLLIIRNSEDTLKTDYRLVENWNPRVDLTRRTATHTYVLSVTDLDFE